MEGNEERKRETTLKPLHRHERVRDDSHAVITVHPTHVAREREREGEGKGLSRNEKEEKQ